MFSCLLVKVSQEKVSAGILKHCCQSLSWLIRLSILPDKYYQVSSKEHVQETFLVISNGVAKTLANDYVPVSTELLVHRFFEHFRC